MKRRPMVLVVGAGSIGARHVRCFQRTGRADVVVCEQNEAVRKEVAREYSLRDAYADFDTAIAAGPEAVVVCTPAHLHIPMAIKVVDANAHLLLEKPLSTSPDGVDELLRLCREKKRIASVAYVYRAHPVFAAMRAAIQSGRFGRPVQLVATSGQNFPFYRPAYRDIYYKDRATGGGAVQDALTHVVNAAEWIIGPVTKLAADIDHQVLEGVSVEDTVHVIARHGNAQATYSLNQHQAPNESTMTVVCEKGTARFSFHRHEWQSQTEPGADWRMEDQRQIERDDLFINQANAFLDAVDGVLPAACTIDEALQTLRVNLAILKAAETQTWQTIEA
ncbi:MAG: Gfo/Idh/MocA family protein [Planctomycetaceae bacterium]